MRDWPEEIGCRSLCCQLVLESVCSSLRLSLAGVLSAVPHWDPFANWVVCRTHSAGCLGSTCRTLEMLAASSPTSSHLEGQAVDLARLVPFTHLQDCSPTGYSFHRTALILCGLLTIRLIMVAYGFTSDARSPEREDARPKTGTSPPNPLHRAPTSGAKPGQQRL